MGLPTTTTGPTNVYYLTDDTGVSAGPAGGQTGGGSGQPLSGEFTAPSIAAAVQVGYLFASVFQRPVRLVQKYGGSLPWTLITGAPANIALTNTPSGVGY
jgi:hypothetical protein